MAARTGRIAGGARRWLAALLLVAVVSGLTACGGGGLDGDAVAKVGGSSITTATLDHWMSALVGSYYYEKTGGPAPKGLAASPARCVAALEGTTAVGTGGLTVANVAQMRSKCQQLYHVMRKNAMTYLIYAEWIKGQAAEEGVKPTPGEFKRFFAQVKAQQFPTEAQLQQYLMTKGWTLADELASAHKELLAGKLVQALGKDAHKEATLIKKWTAMTDCRTGYVVEQCKQYKASKAGPEGPSAAVLIEELAGLRPGPPAKKNPREAEDEICSNAPNGKGVTCVIRPVKH